MGLDITQGMALAGGIVGDIANANTSANAVNQQIGAQKKMALFNKEQQFDLFNKTGYEAQVRQMKNAGLNPALMYKGAGSGGQTNLATSNVEPKVFESKIGNSMDILNTELTKSQIELANSQAEKNKAEANKIEGVDTTEAQTRIDSIIKNTEGKNIQNELDTINLEIQKTAKENGLQYENLKNSTMKLAGEMQLVLNDAYISNTTKEDMVKIVKQDLINSGLQGELTRANITYTEEETKAIAKRLAQIDKSLGYEERKTAVQEAFKDFGTGTAAEIERAVRIGGNVVNTVTDVIPQTRTIKKLETITNYDKNGNYNGEQNRSTEYINRRR